MDDNRNSPFAILIPVVFLLGLIFIIWDNLTISQDQNAAHFLNKKLPSFDLPTLNDPKLHLTNKDLKGGVVLLNFWASWCTACRRENGVLLTIKNTYHIPIYGIDFSDTEANAKSWLKKMGNPFVTTGVDAYGSVGTEFGLYGTPETFVIDADGIIRYIHVGAMDQKTFDNTLLPIIQKLNKTPAEKTGNAL